MPDPFMPPDQRVPSGGAPTRMGPAGFWLDAQGNVAATTPDGALQVTPGAAANPQGQILYDAAKDLYYTVSQGQKQYQSPYNYAGADQKASTAKGTGRGMLQTMQQGGGAFHGRPSWNATKGAFDVALDWGKIGSLAAGGAIAAGAAGPIATALSSGVGPSTAANMAATTVATAPPAALATGVTSAVTPAVAGLGASATPSTSNWLSGVLKAALPVAGTIADTLIQAHAQGKATEAEQKALAEALAYEKERDTYGLATEANRYASLSRGVSPYVATGSRADSRFADLLRLPQAPDRAAAVTPPTYPTPPLPGSAPGTLPAGTVTMQAPDGTTKQVPADQIAQWTAKGATRISA